MRLARATVSTAGKSFRVLLDGRVSAELPRLTLLRDRNAECPIVVGDRVAVLFFGDSLADGVILGLIP